MPAPGTPSRPRIELATAADIPALAVMRAEQGWHPNARLLRSILAWDGGRIFVIRAATLATAGAGSLTHSATHAEAPIATVVATASGTVGVIGNVIVAGHYRKRGLARALMEAALRWQHERGVQHVLLAATPDGRPLYRRLGFVDTELSWFAHSRIAALDLAAIREHAGDIQAELLPASALRGLAVLDAAAYGGDRLGLLDALLRHGKAGHDAWLYATSANGAEPSGYLILRRPHAMPDVLQIGPWVARTHAAALALVRAALGEDAPWRSTVTEEITLFAVGPHRAAMDLLVSVGARLGEDDIVMQLDFVPDSPPESIAGTRGPAQPVAEHPEWLYAWLAPMVF